MKILDIVNRVKPSRPWAEGENLPWNDPAFSERMLHEHFCQDHDHASRRFTTIVKHVTWIHHELLNEVPTRILDLGCGPRLYTHQLAQLGHSCVGIDFSPASIAYATAQAQKAALPCTYLLQDIRDAEYGANFGLVMLLYGELNSFSPHDAQRLVTKAYHTLHDTGILLLESHKYDAVEKRGTPSTSWYTAPNGLFSPRPHLCLEESYWDAVSQTRTTRFYIVDGATGEVQRYAQTAQAYTTEEYIALLRSCGFSDITFIPSLTGSDIKIQDGLHVITAIKPPRAR